MGILVKNIRKETVKNDGKRYKNYYKQKRNERIANEYNDSLRRCVGIIIVPTLKPNNH